MESIIDHGTFDLLGLTIYPAPVGQRDVVDQVSPVSRKAALEQAYICLHGLVICMVNSFAWSIHLHDLFICMVNYDDGFLPPLSLSVLPFFPLPFSFFSPFSFGTARYRTLGMTADEAIASSPGYSTLLIPAKPYSFFSHY